MLNLDHLKRYKKNYIATFLQKLPDPHYFFSLLKKNESYLQGNEMEYESNLNESLFDLFNMIIQYFLRRLTKFLQSVKEVQSFIFFL